MHQRTIENPKYLWNFECVWRTFNILYILKRLFELSVHFEKIIKLCDIRKKIERKWKDKTNYNDKKEKKKWSAKKYI